MTASSEKPRREHVVKCSNGDLSADDLDKLVDQLCSPGSKFPYKNPIYLSQVALLELAKRLRAPALSEVIPDVCVEDDGDIAIEWYRDKRNLISISTDGKVLAAVWILDGKTASITWGRDDETPADVNDALRQLAESGRAK